MKNRFQKRINARRKFQQLAIDLEKAIGKVSPRPAVGAVLVLNGKVIGEGKTNISPGDHAEVEAAKNASDKTFGATCIAH